VRGKRLKRYTIVLAVLCLLVIVAAIVIPRFLDLNRYRDSIVAQIGEAIDGDAGIGSISWSIANGLTIEAEDFYIADAALFPVDISVERISIGVSVVPLIRKDVVIDDLHLSGPKVTVRLAPVQHEDRPTPSADGDSSPAPMELPVGLAIRELAMVRGQVTIEDAITLPNRQKVYALDNVKITGTNLVPGEEMGFSLAFEDTADRGIGAFEAEGTFRGLTASPGIVNPALTCKAKITGLTLDVLKPYLGARALAQKMGGVISLVAEYSGNLGSRFAVDGVIDLSRFTYADPALWEGPLRSGNARIKYDVKADPGRIRAQELDLRLGDLLLKLSATLDLGQSPPVVEDIVLSGVLPLRGAIPWVPWVALESSTDIVRPILEAGGEIRLAGIEIPRLEIGSLPRKWAPVLNRSKGRIQLTDVSLQPLPTIPPIEVISGSVTLARGVLDATVDQARLGPVTFPTLHARVVDAATQPKVSASITGRVGLPGDSGPRLGEHLRRYGLSRLTGRADLDLTAYYDTSQPDSWKARGSLHLDGVTAELGPSGVHLESLTGRIRLQREEEMGVYFDTLTGSMDEARFSVDGSVTRIGSPQLAIHARTGLHQLDLSRLEAVVPYLERLHLEGVADADMDIELPIGDPYRARFNGYLKVKGIGAHLAASELVLGNGDAYLEFTPDRIELKSLGLELNGQPISIRGHAVNPRRPDITIAVTAPNLDVDSLLPKAPHGGYGPAERGGRPETLANRPIPDYVRNMTIQFHASVDRGRYRQTDFTNLSLTADYEDGQVKDHQLRLGIADGEIHSTGIVDIRNLYHVGFAVKPTIESLDLGQLSTLFNRQQLPVEGTITVSGSLGGAIGNRDQLISSLNGRLSAELTRGRVFDVGLMGSIIVKVLSLTNLRGILSGDVVRDMSGEGVAFKRATLDADMRDGVLHAEPLVVEGNALGAASIGDVDFVQGNLTLKVEVEPLGTVDAVLERVPILGRVGQKLTRIYLDVEGPFTDPDIRVSPAKGLSEAVREGFRSTKGAVDDALDRVRGTE